jgi:PAS domain S-box-containing protein
MEQASDGIAVVDQQGRYIEVNSRMCDMMGYSRAEFLKLAIKDVLAPEDLAAKPLRFSDLLTGEAVLSERLLRRKDGSTFPVEISAKMIPDGRLCGIHRDITKRKQVEEALRKSEKFIRDILETVDEGFIVIDRDYRIISANKAYLDQVKMPLEKVIGRHCYEISHRIVECCHKMGDECPVKHTFDTGEPHTALHIHHDGEKNLIYVETKSYPLKDATGYVISAIEIINNTTEKKKLEDQLRHFQKMEAVGQLAGGVAHDFNNILTAITGYGCLMKMKMDEHDPLRNNLQQILDASERAANLTRSLLAFSRKQAISPRPVNLNKIIENVEKLLQRLISEDVEVKVILTNKDLTVMADSSQIEQILMNLVTNASDAMLERGCLTISTGTVVLDHEFVRINGFGKPGPYALFSVTDTGTGMDEKTKRKIFEPFFTTKEAGKGTGLGLSIVYGIVKQHDGYITCYSEPDMGTTFKIYLPMIKRETAKTESAVLHPVSNGTETILVAEDDAAVNKLVKETLEQFGYTVIEAVDGEDAISKFKNNRDKVKLLILDVIMPKKNGKEVYEEIRKDRPDVKVIFSSGYMADILHKKGVLEEDLSFISKPVSPTELLRKVRETLDKG